ncbi:expressed unknown protein [Seminavis robusta]|uniref:Fatty acid hydroxylase domain-containing protein n=1 Tax=Seminavis robusta TaxID=568900 RepID=A0A9N8HCF9_9STRA|nr:expressed unknown protein [Seminavis robusta]|eukprot:Sro300_g111720.1 n/a (260) ;mRNA; f:30172-30951
MQNIVDTVMNAFSDKQQIIDTVKDTFDFPPGEVESTFMKGLEIVNVTIIVTIILELYSLDTTKIIWAKDKSLYLQAVALNFVNHYLYGIPVYMVAALFFVRKVDEEYSAAFVALQTLGVMAVHSLCYYEMHKTFHTFPKLYKYHKFHHRFHTHVTPMVANAVGFVEYMLAYVVPFAVAGAIVRPYADCLILAVYITSLTNLSIHTPKIEAWSEKNMPSWLVSTHDHLEHHKKLTVHYGAPTLNVDWAVAKLNGGGRKVQ